MTFTPVPPYSRPRPRAVAWWILAVAGIVAIGWIVGRRPAGVSDHGVFHALYLAAYVVLPGAVLLRVWWGRSLRWSEVVAVGLPLGLVVEAAVYPALVASGGRAWYAALPVVWLSAAWSIRKRVAAGGWLRAPGWEVGPAAAVFAAMGVVLALRTVGLHSIAVRLDDGILATPTHHDWVYLLARAQEIMTHRTWQDPSLAGVGLSYHFLLLLHAAAAATVTGVEIDTVLFRTALLPFGAVLLAQMYWLGRRVTRRRAGGVLAMVLLLLPAAKWTRDQEGGAFLDFFGRWLFVSPTFFIGLVFFGALMVGIYEAVARPGAWRRHGVGLLLLALGGALAKATVVPALAVAVTAWALAGPIARPWGRRCGMMVGAAAVLTAGWAGIYMWVLSDWGTGALRWAPGVTLKVMPFGQNNLETWGNWLAAFLPTTWAGPTSLVAVAVVAVAALSGVRMAALLLVLRRWGANKPLAGWIAWCAVASLAWGLLVSLDSNGQLYFLLPLRLPMAVLGAAGLCALGESVTRNVRAFAGGGPRLPGLVVSGCCAAGVSAVMACSGVAAWMWAGTGLAILLLWSKTTAPGTELVTVGGRGRWGASLRLVAGATLLVMFAATGAVQARLIWVMQEMDMKRWWREEQGSFPQSVPLRSAMLWARENVPIDAVFVADASTSRHLRGITRPVVIDNTSIDKHYYYTAWAARRFWLEGTSYIQRREEIAPRIEAADALFEQGVSPQVGGRPLYVLIDRALPGGGATARAEWGAPLFANERAEIYAVP